MKLFCLAYLGREAEARAMLDQRVLARPGIGTTEDKTGVPQDILSLEAAVLVRHREAAELLLHRLAGSSIRTTAEYFLTCTARHLGGAAALLDRYEEARKYYQEAIKVCTEMKFRPELALSTAPTCGATAGALPAGEIGGDSAPGLRHHQSSGI